MPQVPSNGAHDPGQRPVPFPVTSWFSPQRRGERYCLRCSQEALSVLTVIGIRYPLCGECLHVLADECDSICGDEIYQGDEGDPLPEHLVPA